MMILLVLPVFNKLVQFLYHYLIQEFQKNKDENVHRYIVRGEKLKLLEKGEKEREKERKRERNRKGEGGRLPFSILGIRVDASD